MNGQELLKEDGQFFTDEELLEMDDALFQTSGEIMKKISGITSIIGKHDNSVQRLRREYLSLRSILKDKKKALEEEQNEKGVWKDKANSLHNKYEALKAKYEELEKGLERANREKDDGLGEIRKLEKQLIEQREEYRTREKSYEEIRQDYRERYEEEKAQKEQAESDFQQCRKDYEILQECLKKESEALKAKESETEEQKKQLQAKNDRIQSLDEKVRRYEGQRENMPFLVRLCDAYDCIMEKRDELPREFFECLQNVVPSDDFDRFLSRALEPSFPVYYHDAVQSFLVVCRHRGEVSDETVKKALSVLDALLSIVLDFGNRYFEEERFVRIQIEAGDPFDKLLCRYIDEGGGIYGKIVEVWLHGFKDEKKNKVYCSYVEGE